MAEQLVQICGLYGVVDYVRPDHILKVEEGGVCTTVVIRDVKDIRKIRTLEEPEEILRRIREAGGQA